MGMSQLNDLVQKHAAQGEPTLKLSDQVKALEERSKLAKQLMDDIDNIAGCPLINESTFNRFLDAFGRDASTMPTNLLREALKKGLAVVKAEREEALKKLLGG